MKRSLYFLSNKPYIYDECCLKYLSKSKVKTANVGGNVQAMMQKVFLSIPRRLSGSPFHSTRRRFFSDVPSLVPELPRVDSLVGGCDYKHWLVVMHSPENYPHRDEIVQQYVSTLALALGSEKRTMESIYSVSTKYYYAFSCEASENVIQNIKSLPRVKWVLSDSYLCSQESGYGGEPYVNGKVVPYDEKYHAEWFRSNSCGEGSNSCGEGYPERTCSKRRARRKRRGSRNSHDD